MRKTSSETLLFLTGNIISHYRHQHWNAEQSFESPGVVALCHLLLLYFPNCLRTFGLTSNPQIPRIAIHWVVFVPKVGILQAELLLITELSLAIVKILNCSSLRVMNQILVPQHFKITEAWQTGSQQELLSRHFDTINRQTKFSALRWMQRKDSFRLCNFWICILSKDNTSLISKRSLLFSKQIN